MIKVGENYQITVGSHDYTAYYVRFGKGKDGVEKNISTRVGYYNTPLSALEGIMRYEVKERLQEDVELAEAVQIIKDVNNEMRGLLEQLTLDLKFFKEE